MSHDHSKDIRQESILLSKTLIADLDWYRGATTYEAAISRLLYRDAFSSTFDPTPAPSICLSPELIKRLDLFRGDRSMEEFVFILLDTFSVPPHQHPPAWTLSVDPEIQAKGEEDD